MYLLPRRTLPPIDGLPIAPESQLDDAPKPKPNYLGTKPPPAPPSMMPNATPNQNAGKYLLPLNNMPIPVAPEPEQPIPARPNYLGTRPPALPTTPNMELGSMPSQATNIPLPMSPTPEPPSPVGRMPILTNSRNVSGITPPPAVTPQQSDDLDGLGNTAKYVRGSEGEAPNYLGQRPPLDPLGQARQEAGSLKKLGFWGRLGQIGKGALLGAISSGGGDLSTVLGGALGGGIAGGTDYLRKSQQQQQIQQRAGEIAQAKAYERQAQEDRLNYLYKDAQMNNLNVDNKRQQEDLEERKRRNQANEKLAQERQTNLKNYRDLTLKARTDSNAANIRRQAIDRNIKLMNQPGLTQEQRNLYAEELNAMGQFVPSNYDPTRDELRMTTNPSTGEVSVVNVTRGTAQGVTGADGQPFIQTPKPTTAAVNAQAQADALANTPQDPDAPDGTIKNPQAVEFAKNNKLEWNDPYLDKQLKKLGIDRYTPITKSPSFQKKVVQGTANSYLGNRPIANSTNTNKPANRYDQQQSSDLQKRVTGVQQALQTWQQQMQSSQDPNEKAQLQQKINQAQDWLNRAMGR